MLTYGGKRLVRNKTTQEIIVQYSHLYHGEFIFLPINDNFEYVNWPTNQGISV